MKIGDFLKIKGRPIITTGPNETVAAAIQKLVENNIGALPVIKDDGTLLGIVSERDLLKECLKRSGAISHTKVQGVMTSHVAVATPEQDLDYATSVMKQKKIRHLPIVVGQKLEGMISMRDILDIQLEEVQAEIRYVGLLHRRSQRRLI